MKLTLYFPRKPNFIHKLKQEYLPCLRILAYFMIATKETHLKVQRAHLDHNSKFVFAPRISLKYCYLHQHHMALKDSQYNKLTPSKA